MSYKFTAVPPVEHLNFIVKNFFVIEFDEDKAHTDYLLPDGLPSFFYIQTSEPIDAYFGDAKNPISVQKGFYLGYSNKIVSFSHKRIKIVGASIFPVYMSLIFGKSLLKLINKFTRLDKISVIKPVELLLNTTEKTFDGVFDVFEKFIQNQIDQHEFSKDFSLVYQKLTEPGGYYLNVEELAAQLECSTRYLRARFWKFFGMSPKKFIKLVRFNHALKYIYDMEESKNLSFIAHEVGYHDQSHFIRDFKEICGKTPRQISANSDSLANKFRLF